MVKPKLNPNTIPQIKIICPKNIITAKNETNDKLLACITLYVKKMNTKKLRNNRPFLVQQMKQ